MDFQLEFYRTLAGECPALDYIRTQVRAHQAKIGRALRFLEEAGYQARRPEVDYVGDGIYELRVPIQHHQHRLLYFFRGRTIIVVADGFLKNEDRIPFAILERAKRRRQDWLQRFGAENES